MTSEGGCELSVEEDTGPRTIRPLTDAVPSQELRKPSPSGPPNTINVRRLLVTASRDWPAPALLRNVLEMLYRPHIVLVVGDATGGDRVAARQWTKMGGSVSVYRADWKNLGRRAGHARNEVMCHSLNPGTDLGLAFIFNNSRGATHCKTYAQSWGIVTYTWALSGPEWSAE